MLMKKLNNRKGFTLIELMIVIAILAILAAFIVPFVASVAVSTSDDNVNVITQEQEAELQEKDEVPVQEDKVKSESKGDKRL